MNNLSVKTFDWDNEVENKRENQQMNGKFSDKSWHCASSCLLGWKYLLFKITKLIQIWL